MIQRKTYCSVADANYSRGELTAKVLERMETFDAGSLVLDLDELTEPGTIESHTNCWLLAEVDVASDFGGHSVAVDRSADKLPRQILVELMGTMDSWEGLDVVAGDEPGVVVAKEIVLNSKDTGTRVKVVLYIAVHPYLHYIVITTKCFQCHFLH